MMDVDLTADNRFIIGPNIILISVYIHVSLNSVIIIVMLLVVIGFSRCKRERNG